MLMIFVGIDVAKDKHDRFITNHPRLLPISFFPLKS